MVENNRSTGPKPDNAGIYSRAREAGLLDSLTPMARDVLNLRYGSEKTLSLTEVGHIIGKSSTTTRNIEQQALGRIRRVLG